MNKHNIVELFDYKKNKDKVEHEHKCYGFLDQLSERIRMANTYHNNFKKYVECMARDGDIEQYFADNLLLQADFMFTEVLKSREKTKVGE